MIWLISRPLQVAAFMSVAISLPSWGDDATSGPASSELALLAALVGQWEGEFEIGANSGNKLTAEQSSQWILDGWWLETHSAARNAKGESFKVRIITGYDKEKQQFVRTMYFTGGGIFHERGSFDPATKTFTFQEVDAPTRATKTSTATIENVDEIRWKIVLQRSNEPPIEVNGVNRRKK